MRSMIVEEVLKNMRLMIVEEVLKNDEFSVFLVTVFGFMERTISA